MSAVQSLYDITGEGREALQKLDVRWMRDQPGYFGSFGYKGWTGVGEARPIGVIHELSHAYWGLFPVTGLPQLSWDAPEGAVISPAMERYHKDVLEFMRQPPDHFEPLRSRLRNLPEVSSSNPDPLFHTIEADAIYTATGDLELIPPVLRKYWEQFLQPGPFYSWYEALSWYQSLPPGSKKLANKYVGFEHFDLGNYGLLKNSESTQLQKGVGEILLREDRQRLSDFVEMFDQLSAYVVGRPEDEENFKFWRRYLRDKLELHKRHPKVVASLNLPRSKQIPPALDFLEDIVGKGPDEKADLVIQELGTQPFLAHFLPALDNRTLLKVFTSGAELPEKEILKGTAAFVESLEKFTPHINKILEGGRRDVSGGADELTSYLSKADFQKKEDLELFFEILEGSDRDTVKQIVGALDDSTLRRLLKVVPAKLRFLLAPPRFLEFLNITLDSSPEKLAQGIQDMMIYPSGNFRIDEPFLDEMYSVIAARGRREPLETLNVIAGSPFPMERFLSLNPAAAVDILGSDLDTTSEIVKTSDPVLFSPARFVYRLIYADPEFAARLVGQLDQRNEDDLVVEALAHFAYDADRLQAVPELPISLDRDGRFLQRLLNDKGAEWLEDRMGRSADLFRRRVERGEVADDFLMAYRRTLVAAVSRLQDGEARSTLGEIVDRLL